MTEYLQENCGQKLTLAQMAGGCQVSTGDFCRFFKKHMGMTPFEYLQKCRIWNSMDAVLDKTSAMGEIAALNGFAGASYFSETFRKEMAVLRLITGNGTKVRKKSVRFWQMHQKMK